MLRKLIVEQNSFILLLVELPLLHYHFHVLVAAVNLLVYF